MNSSVSRTTRVWLILVCTFFVWVFKWYDCYQEKDNNSSFAGVKVIVSFFSQSGGNANLIMSGIFFVLVLTHMRIFFGIEFADKDSSFNEALSHLDEVVRERLTLFMEITMAILMALTVLLTYFVSISDPWPMAALIFSEGVLIIVFDIKLSYVLLTIDKEKYKNYLIVANDIVFFIMGCIFLLVPTLAKLNWYISRDVIVAAGVIYTFLLGGEIVSQYRESIAKSYADAREALLFFIKEFCGSAN